MKKFFILFFFIVGLSVINAQTYVQLILDASGSMWNTLEDGRYRIIAAKEVLTNFVTGLPDGDLNVGLRIYGSQKNAIADGSCEDSKLFVPMQGIEKSTLTQTIQEADAQGATPIAYSLEQAAEDFPENAQKRLIVLVTDGEESCAGDLQAVAAQLRQQGIEIDLKIIGFDLSETAAASFKDIGEFVNAEDAKQLAIALQDAVEKVVEPPAPLGDATLEVPSEVMAGQSFSVSWQGPDKSQDYITIVSVNSPDSDYGNYKYTSEGSPLSLYAPIEPGQYEVRYQSDRVSGVAARAEVTVLEAEITLSAPLEIPAGQSFMVNWTGPNGNQDYITIVPANSADGQYGSYSYTREGSPITIHAPITAGEYEIRYQSDREEGIFARRSIAVVPAEIRLIAPEKVSAGEPVEVTWTGPNGNHDYITIVPIDAPEGDYKDYRYTREGSPLKLNTPPQSGAYEIRYQSDREEGVFARIPITITDLKITLQAPAEVAAGEKFEVSWQGPDGEYDYITIVPAGSSEGTYKSYFYTKNANPGKLTAPDKTGQYEIRYSTDRSGSKGKIFASIAISVK